MSKTTAALPTTNNAKKRRNSREDRIATLKDSADVAGKSWANRARTELKSQGRSASGGWPGTMSEARLEVMEAVIPEIRTLGLDAISMTEREDTARKLYAAARHSWLAYREPEEN